MHVLNEGKSDVAVAGERREEEEEGRMANPFYSMDR